MDVYYIDIYTSGVFHVGPLGLIMFLCSHFTLMQRERGSRAQV